MMRNSLESTLDFLRLLKTHNSRDWFEANRAKYEAARTAYTELVGDLIDRFDQVDDIGGVTPKECMFRINRDVRFSKDKSPYKTAMGAVLGRAGRASTGRIYYLHVEPDGSSFLAGGLYEPSPAELGAMRAVLARDSRPFRKILGAKDFRRYFGELGGESLKTAPQGYPKDHPDIDLLRMKQFMASHPMSDETLLSGDPVSYILNVFKA
ncbi:MAG TPA: DUF2461 domain-containing protein, partial [Rectinemataceae bacterium]|nr:DUF2461 domain-containing protein [Rectinemataceae bacterium]